MKVEINFEKIINRINEEGYLFFESSRFVHEPGCKNVRLVRKNERKDNKNFTTRSCTECGKSDVDITNIVDRIF